MIYTTSLKLYGKDMVLYEPYLEFPYLVIFCQNLKDYLMNSSSILNGIRTFNFPKEEVEKKIRRKFRRIPKKGIMFSIQNLVIEDIRDSFCVRKEDHSWSFGFGYVHDVRQVPISRRDFILEENGERLLAFMELSKIKERKERWTQIIFSEIDDKVDIKTSSVFQSGAPNANLSSFRNKTLEERLKTST